MGVNMIKQISRIVYDELYNEIEVYMVGENKHIPEYIVTREDLEVMAFGC